MKPEDRSPHDPEVRAAALKFIRSMTPEEAMAFLEYRTPGIEETDMTGHFPINPERPILASAQTLQKKSA